MPNNNQVLANLRALMAAGAPQVPMKSHVSAPPATIGKPSGFEKPMPMGDSPLAEGQGFMGLLNKATMGLVGDVSNPLEAAMPMAGPRFMPSERRMEELVSKFGGRAEPLPMDEASRMARADALGYTHDVYHGTNKDFTEFNDPIRYGGYGSGDFGIHVSSDPLAANRRSNALNPDEGNFPLDDVEQGARVLPLKAQMNKTLTLPDMGIWKDPSNYIRKYHDALDEESGRDAISDPEFMGRMAEEAMKIKKLQGVNYADQMDLWQHKARELMQDAGYDSIKYANNVESDGAPSYLLMDPRQLRSKFAAFDPKRANSRDLLASLAAAIGGGAVASHEQDK
jgi:hypothetical protein